MYSAIGHQNIVPVFRQKDLAEFVRLRRTDEINVKFDDNSVVSLSGWRRPEDQILYLLDFEHPENKIQICFGIRICFNIIYSDAHKVGEEYSREQFYDYIQIIRDRHPNLYSFINDVLIWNI